MELTRNGYLERVFGLYSAGASAIHAAQDPSAANGHTPNGHSAAEAPIPAVPSEPLQEEKRPDGITDDAWEMYLAIKATDPISRMTKVNVGAGKIALSNPTWNEHTDTYVSSTEALYFAPPDVMANWTPVR